MARTRRKPYSTQARGTHTNAQETTARPQIMHYVFVLQSIMVERADLPVVRGFVFIELLLGGVKNEGHFFA